MPTSHQETEALRLSGVPSYTVGVRQSQNLNQGLSDFRLCAQCNPFALFYVEREEASPRTTNYKGNFPLASSETLPGYPTAHCKATNT